MANMISDYTASGAKYEIKDLKDLIGSQKQVAWANSIRKRIFSEIMDKITPDYVDRIAVLLTEFDAEHTSARYWIDNDRHSDAVCKEFYKFASERM